MLLRQSCRLWQLRYLYFRFASRFSLPQERKLRELQDVGVPGKYRAELVRTKIGP